MFYLTSTYSITTSLRRTLVELQRDLDRSQKELATGRHADLGLALGMRAGLSYSLGDTYDTAQSILATNDLVSTRLDTTQTAIANLLSNAQAMRATLMSSLDDGGDVGAIETQARVSLSNFISTLNSGDGDSFLFAGVNSEVAPINNYFADPPSPNKVALDAAFIANFGFAQTDPRVADITGDQMEAFLSGPMTALFAPEAWKTDWSNASDQPLRSQISMSVTIDTSVTANAPALQKLAMAYTMMTDLGASGMNSAAYKALLKSATEVIDDSISALLKTQAQVGVMQRNVVNANQTMTIQSNAIEMNLNSLETVDLTEAAARVNGLMTQIETAYTLTAKITQLSLAKYL
ncbi:flagellar hook-associated family protein [Methylocystis sp. ATCC 49242]|uniref:flagellar hook-associated family protein n=1 Tax=Methylocystis sp. ATCC 49242 TaxID=622637 RepID=UPI0001F87369|nr:flagellar hook-associated family protein [Methylocystis sp. ATCC 49242]